MKLYKKYKAVIIFILSFLGAYFLLAVLYNWFLEVFSQGSNAPDLLTKLVARQSQALISTFGYEVRVFQDANFPVMNLWVNSQFVSRIIEGCNSASIIILFISFMVAFFGKIKSTILFIFAGSVIIYATNIMRIALLSIGIYELPHYAHFLHKIVFPL
ncbi:MAG TPA: exosortase family protein XrtF, partial [Salinimicrobium sp.]|nr:exosortase family protein XrtF [Salinimicrobium sp.]